MTPLGFRAALLDIDGTLLEGDDPIPGAAQALRTLRARGVTLRLCTNTTRRPRRVIASVLRAAGMPVDVREIVAPSSLARQVIVESRDTRAALLVPPESLEDFEGVREDRHSPAFVVLGDMGPGFTFERLNEAFLWLRGGARLIALQKNRFWHAGDRGLLLDAGAFVAALEYAAGVTARVVGKPSPDFFRLALDELGVAPRDAVSVGDSLPNDGAGAAAAGCRTILVRTGVFDARELAASEWQPDAVIDSIASLAELTGPPADS
jgi:phospholysine phosphohistidine inorganic pyrophosphate phosphatase